MGAHRIPEERTLDRVGVVLAFVLVLALCLPLLFVPSDAHAGPFGRAALGVVSVMYDDGFYYLELARNLAEGRGSSLDGRHPTNGYHPLWLLVLVPLWKLAGSREAALVALFLLQAALAGSAAALVYRAARALGTSPLPAALASLAFVHHQTTYWLALSGMEYALQCLLVCVLGLGVVRDAGNDAGRRRFLSLGFAGALAALARLDNALLVGLLSTSGARGRRGMREAMALLLPSILLVGGYLLFNLLFFGHPLPVSAVVKADWSAELLARDPVATRHGLIAAKLANLAWPFANMPRSFLLLPCLGLAAALVLVLATARLDPRQRALRPLAAFAWLQVLAYAWTYHGGYSFQPWYFAVQPWLGAVVLARGAEALLQANRRPALRAAGAALAVSALATLLLALTARHLNAMRERQVRFLAGDPLYSAALWARHEAPRAAVIGAWNAGLLATVSERTVVNLDGLVSSWDYHERGRLDPCRYWREAGITLLVDAFDLDSPPGGEAASPCAAALRRVWVGPAYPGSGRRAAAFAVPPLP